MQEQINEKTIALQVSTVKVTTRVLRSLLAAYLRNRKEKKYNKRKINKPKAVGGKTTLEKLSKKHDGLKNIEITKKNIKDFEKTAKKYNLEYALKKDDKSSPPTYFVFFKGRDLDVIDFAFREYLKESLDKAKENRPSISLLLKRMMEKASQLNKNKVKLKEQEQSL